MKIVKFLLALSLILLLVANATPQVVLQGGDNIENAFVIPSIPFIDSGTTTGFTDDYNGNCGLSGGAPDVVYSYTPSHNVGI